MKRKRAGLTPTGPVSGAVRAVQARAEGRRVSPRIAGDTAGVGIGYAGGRANGGRSHGWAAALAAVPNTEDGGDVDAWEDDGTFELAHTYALSVLSGVSFRGPVAVVELACPFLGG